MKLLIKQRVFSWSDTYDVYDEYGNTKYFVKAKMFSLGHQIHIYDKENNELGIIKQKVFSMMPTFEIEVGGKKLGSIQRKFAFLKPAYKVDYNDWRCEGDFMAWNYKVYDCCSVAVSITKELFHWGDTYVIDYANPNDELLALMLVIAIDAANCSQGK